MKLEGCQYKCLRTICNKKWEDLVHYMELFELLQEKDIVIHSVEALIRKKRFAYVNQILKMDDFTLVKQVVFQMRWKGVENQEALLHHGDIPLHKI